MMNKKEFAKNILTTCAIIYTVVSLSFLVISALLLGDTDSIAESTGKFITISNYLFIFAFALFASIASNICKLDKIPDSAKIFINAFGYIGGFFFFIVLPKKQGFTGAVTITLMFAVGYIILKTLIHIITYDEKGGKEKMQKMEKASITKSKNKPAPQKSAKAQKKMKDEEYVSLFSSKSDK